MRHALLALTVALVALAGCIGRPSSPPPTTPGAASTPTSDALSAAGVPPASNATGPPPAPANASGSPSASTSPPAAEPRTNATSPPPPPPPRVVALWGNGTVLARASGAAASPVPVPSGAPTQAPSGSGTPAVLDVKEGSPISNALRVNWSYAPAPGAGQPPPGAPGRMTVAVTDASGRLVASASGVNVANLTIPLANLASPTKLTVDLEPDASQPVAADVSFTAILTLAYTA